MFAELQFDTTTHDLVFARNSQISRTYFSWSQATAALSTIGYWHDTVVCLSVCLSVCALWLNDTSYSKSV